MPPARPPLLAHLLVPVANADDARATAQVLRDYSPGKMTVVHVIEKGEGVPDTKPLEQSEQLARESLDAFGEFFPDADEQIAYGRDVVATIIDVAAEVEASAIAFRPRGGSRVTQFLSGDPALRLVTECDRPVIALPDAEKR